MTKFPKIFITPLLLVLSFLCLPINIHASSSPSVFFVMPKVVKVGDTFEVAINADTAGMLINSLNLSLTYNNKLLSFAGYKDENTVVSIWIDAPKEDAGTISMSGIIPGGVSELYDPNKRNVSQIPLVRLLFKANVSGEANFDFLQTQILKHDGKGTELVHEAKDAILEINGALAGGVVENSLDQKSPEPFSLTFVGSSLFSRTPDMVVFNAVDVDSGIKEYKIKIGLRGWQDAQSPYPIPRSIFSRNVIVQAIDFYGNTQEANLIVSGVIPSKVLLIIVLLILAGILGFKLLKYKS
jgi:hypothetical protein